jgi:hypothetical protein
MKTWLFWDWWHIEHQDNVELRQSEPQWVPEGTYEDPGFDYLASWPTVYEDQVDGIWRMLYPISGFPLSLMGAESEDGIRWHPLARPDINPGTQKIGPNHLLTIEAANGGPVYIDPAAQDGSRFKLFCVQRGGAAAKRGRLDADSSFHETVQGRGVKAWAADNLVASSPDGLHWRLRENADWESQSWHPDPPLFCFYNARRGVHTLVTRPGWGDRRIAFTESPDTLTWSHPELALQPDPMDPPQTQMYGMPVHPYEGAFVGFLWLAHFSSAQRLGRFNRLWGTIDSQLTYSSDGMHWQRGFRRPFISLNEPGQPGSGIIYPTCLVETEDRLRIYSAATLDLHMQHTTKQFTPKGIVPPTSIILHELRKHGFTYLTSSGHWATLTTKPVVLLSEALTMNALAPHGEIHYQLTDLKSRPLDGFTFEECIPFRDSDDLAFQLRWRGKTLREAVGRVVRLEIQLCHARVYSFSGNFHFVDALDVALMDAGEPIKVPDWDF